jgi:hypothetical protein
MCTTAMNKFFIDRMQRQVVNVSIGAALVRGLGPAGTAEKVREFLYKFDLRSVQLEKEPAFLEKLECATQDLMKALPKGGQPWGRSRKYINIFLRNCLYNQYLCKHYALEKLEDWLEVPLDSHVGRCLRGDKKCGGELPRWRNIIGLTLDLSGQYQAVANCAAKRGKIARVHLDIFYWRAAASCLE